jgi:hypothetical protein
MRRRHARRTQLQTEQPVRAVFAKLFGELDALPDEWRARVERLIAVGVTRKLLRNIKRRARTRAVTA